jgi:hypothetical protein
LGRHAGERRPLLGQEGAAVIVERRYPARVVRRQPGGHQVGPVLVRLLAAGKRLGGLAQGGVIRRRPAQDHRRPVVLGPQAQLAARRGGQARRALVVAEQAVQAPAGEIQGGHQIVEAAFVEQPGQVVHGPRGGAVGFLGGGIQHAVARFAPQFRRRAFVHHLEMGGDPGFQGEAAQQGFAERMDGADIGAVRGVGDFGEHAADTGQVGMVERHTGLLAVVFLQGVVVHHRPFAQQPRQPVGHLGGRGLGIGQAKNMARAHPAQQQPHDPVGQHVGLAGPRVGGDPGRNARLRRVGLNPGGLCAGFLHSPSSPPTALQARTRARWS